MPNTFSRPSSRGGSGTAVAGATRRRPWAGLQALAPALIVLAIAGATAGCGHRPTTHRVVVDATKFTPEVLTVTAGDTVLWINKDLFPHTATSQGRFDSGPINPGNSWQYTITDKGEIDYICTLHPTMKGKLRVQ